MTFLRLIKFTFICVTLSALLIPMRAYPSSAQSGQGTAVDFVLVVDMSSSMWDNDPEDWRIKAIRLFTELLAPEERVAIVGFSAKTELIAGLTYKDKLPAAVWDQLSNDHIPGVGNPIDTSEGLKGAYEILDDRSADEKQNRRTVPILLTDGRPCPNDGDFDREYNDINKQVERFVARGWPVYTVGLCLHEDDDRSVALCLRCDTALLRDIAQKTDGLYFRAKKNTDLPEVYVEILADIYGFRSEVVPVKVVEGQFSPPPQIPPQTKILIVVATQQGVDLEAACPAIVKLTPLVDRPYSQKTSCVEDMFLLRTDASDGSLGGVWQASTTAPEAEIEAILINVDYEVRVDRPEQNDQLCAGSEIDVVARLVDQEGHEVIEDDVLGNVELSMEISRDGVLLETVRLNRSGSAVWQTRYRLPSLASHYSFQPAMNTSTRRREEVEIDAVVCEVMATPTPTPTPVIRLDISEDGLEMDNDLIATFGIDSTSTEPEHLWVDSVYLLDASDQSIEDLRAKLQPEQIPPQMQISASLVLTSSVSLAYGEYHGQVNFKSESGVDVVPSKIPVSVHVLSPWERFWRKFGGLIVALLSLSAVGALAYAAWWLFIRPVVDGGLIVNALPVGGSIFVNVKNRKESIQDSGEFIPLSRLKKRRITLGNGSAADIQLTGDDIDDIQTEIRATGWRRRGSQIQVINIGQTNETIVSGVPVGRTPQALYDGDIITLGRYEFEYQNPGRPCPYDR